MKIKLLQIRESTHIKITSAKKVVSEMIEESKADRECFWVLHLDTQLNIIEKELVHMSTLTHASVHPREIFKKAILHSASGIITVHNHPGGNPMPSKDDKNIFKRLCQAGEILGIQVLDHIIITSKGYFYSAQESGDMIVFDAGISSNPYVFV